MDNQVGMNYPCVFDNNIFFVTIKMHVVRCPGDTIHFMRFGYQEYVDRLVELAGIKPRTEWTGYDSWNPYRLQDPEKREP